MGLHIETIVTVYDDITLEPNRMKIDADYLDLRNKNFLGLIYAHLFSVNQIHRLIRRKQLGGGQG